MSDCFRCNSPIDSLQSMDKLARRVAARYGLQQALGSWQPPIPAWAAPWWAQMERLGFVNDPTVYQPPPKKLYQPSVQTKFEPNEAYNPKLHEFTPPPVHPGQDVFDEAKLSIEILLPKVLATLAKKFGSRFYMRATQQRMKLYYYFSAHPAIETITLMLSLRGSYAMIGLGYAPHKINGGADFSKSIQETIVIRDPSVAGLAMMRLLRQLLSKVCSAGSCLD